MKMLKTLPFSLMMVLSLVTSCNNSIDENSDQQKLEEAITNVRTSLEKELGHDVPSISILLETPKGTYFTSSAGKNGTAITADTYFRFASNTKNFTAAAILNMMQDGWLNIDDKIIDNIPNSTQPYLPTTSEWDILHKNEITIKELLQHNAGVFDVSNDPVPGCGGLPYVEYMLESVPNHQFTSTELVNQVKINNLTYGAPNTVYHYSNTGYTMLGEIIARVYTARSGQPKTYGDYLKDKIYGASSKVPLNLHFVDQATDQQLPSPYITGLIQNPTNTVITDLINASAHVAEGNGVGTMAQLNRYIRTMMKGENVLTKNTVTMMQTNKGVANTPEQQYGLGCTHNETLGYGHNGATEGYLSTMMYDPKTDVSLVVLIPYWDLSDDKTSLGKCLQALVNTGITGRQAIGYP
jgi:D-alanyl-D-alanine carboxypeptidase